MREIEILLRIFLDKYNKAQICSIYIKAYSMTFKHMDEVEPLSVDESNMQLIDVFHRHGSILNLMETPTISMKPKKRKVLPYITRKRKPKSLDPPTESEEDTSKRKKKKERGPCSFMVGDIETLPYHVDTDGPKTHVAYAAGYMVVNPIRTRDKADSNRLPNKGYVNRFYSEDYSILYENFLDRSTRMLDDMIASVLSEVHKVKKGGAATLFFHNLARFDGIILLRHLALHLEHPYSIKPLVRNSMIYQILIHKETKDPKRKNKLVLKIRDSCKLLPGSLADLAASFCPEAGGKGEIDHENVGVHKLGSLREEYLDYMDQDIVLLALILQKAQDIYWERYNIDIVADMTISALAMNIFRSEYYDDVHCRIYIPNKNADTFIREGYYGGHADLYIPSDECPLYVYDVNSLYPYIMCTCDMPGGPPVWYSDLSKQKSGMDLKDMFGFIKAFVITPPKMDRPFLPYRMKDRTLLFPTGMGGSTIARS